MSEPDKVRLLVAYWSLLCVKLTFYLKYTKMSLNVEGRVEMDKICIIWPVMSHNHHMRLCEGNATLKSTSQVNILHYHQTLFFHLRRNNCRRDWFKESSLDNVPVSQKEAQMQQNLPSGLMHLIYTSSTLFSAFLYHNFIKSASKWSVWFVNCFSCVV